MIRSDFIARIAGFGIFYRWHPEIALRYLPIVEKIRATRNVKNILEVGSAGLGICPYLNREVTGVDVNFTPPYHPYLKRVKGSVIKLSFTDSSFDIVISMDMLEHLKKKDREKAIYEMLRVARKKVLIGTPAGPHAEREDKLLHEYYKIKFDGKYQFFEEQITEGLPRMEEMDKIIRSSAKNLRKKISFTTIGNENLAMHRFLMKGWMTKNLLIDIFFRKILLFVVPLLRIIDHPPYYRQLFFIDIKNENSN